MNILVTGAGLIGCHFAREMQSRGHQTVLFDLAPNEGYVRSIAGDAPVVKGDIRDLPALVDTMRAHQIKVVFHTAGLIGPRVAERPYTGLNINIGGAISLAEASRLQGVRRLVFASTHGVYNWNLPPRGPVDEDFPVGEDTFYAASKVSCEQILRAYGVRYGLDVAILRFAQVYGRGHFAGGSSGGVAMHAVAEAAARDGLVRIDPSKFGVNEYVYVKDAVRAAILACEQPLKSKVFNVGSGRLESPADLASAIREARPGLDVEVLPGPAERPGHLHAFPLDTGRAAAELGYQPRFDLARGMTDFIQEMESVSLEL
ncbi:MAG: NAD(P)-dependent oxidoreductase [Dehalococcoidia bacterium]|nr:NAD(P)-dependent oxidoreductase [Dehalococcoidia bacterium]